MESSSPQPTMSTRSAEAPGRLFSISVSPAAAPMWNFLRSFDSAPSLASSMASADGARRRVSNAPTTMQEARWLPAVTLLTLNSIDLYPGLSLIELAFSDEVVGCGAAGAQFMLSGQGP